MQRGTTNVNQKPQHTVKYRCKSCNKLLAVGHAYRIEIKCPRCKSLQVFNQ